MNVLYAAFRGNLEFIQNFLQTEVNYLDCLDEHQAAIDRIFGIKGSTSEPKNQDDDVISEDEANNKDTVVTSIAKFRYNKFTPLHCAAYSALEAVSVS